VLAENNAANKLQIIERHWPDVSRADLVISKIKTLPLFDRRILVLRPGGRETGKQCEQNKLEK
jgi:hypothetical protein